MSIILGFDFADDLLLEPWAWKDRNFGGFWSGEVPVVLMDQANKAQRKLAGEELLEALEAQAEVPNGQVHCLSETWIPPLKARQLFQLAVA